MGPKGKTTKVKPDWVLCPDSGLFYHQKDSAQHSAWLTAGSPPSPTFPHIVSDSFTSTVCPVPRSSVGLSLPENVLFSSVFVSPAVARTCKLGQGNIVTLISGDEQMVLRLFVSPSLPDSSSLCCVTRSWPATMAGASFATISSFSCSVSMCRTVQVVVGEDVKDPSSPRFMAAVQFHLTNLILYTGKETVVPLNYYGSVVHLRIRPEDREPHALLDLSHDLRTMLHLTPPTPARPPITSTPQKQTMDMSYSGSPKPSDPSSPKPSLFCRISLATEIKVIPPYRQLPDTKPNFLGGLDLEFSTIVDSMSQVFSGGGDQWQRPFTGLLLFGPPGTGKTSLALKLPASLSVNLVTIAGPELYSKFYGETESQLRGKFVEAAKLSPCILFIDELDSLVPRRESGASDQERRVVVTLLSLLDHLSRGQTKVVVIAATSRIEGVDSAIRRPGRLDMEVEIGVPGVKGREFILAGLLQEAGSEISESDVARVARDTHGFVGADLKALINLAQMGREQGEGGLTIDNLTSVRPKVKPSAMREVMVEVPEVTWSDIGGLEQLKHKLRQAVEWPVRHPEVFSRMGISAPKGLLMYGPPGCSKTMIAKALANESGLNFLSIKGPELFSKWVGESERAVREVFRKARQVQPSIVFFDEIDALGGARGGGGGGGGSRVGDRVLAQLLTEMDGVESLTGVTVVAATNRPDMMDQALLRPGRLDRVVYVPLPDQETRLQVCQVHTKKVPLDPGVDLEQVASKTEGYSGAEVAAVCNEAALAALEESVTAQVVKEHHFTIALQNLKPRISPELFAVYEKFQADNTTKKV